MSLNEVRAGDEIVITPRFYNRPDWSEIRHVLEIRLRP